MAKKILIIDDDPHIVQYLEDVFKDNGYEPITATTGKEGFDLTKTEKPDLITLDLEMPEEWGPQMYRRLTKDPEFAKLPVIVISGLPGSQYAIKNVVASLNKPFDRDELLSIVKKTIGEP